VYGTLRLAPAQLLRRRESRSELFIGLIAGPFPKQRIQACGIPCHRILAAELGTRGGYRKGLRGTMVKYQQGVSA
jgi:hypothetical protein